MVGLPSGRSRAIRFRPFTRAYCLVLVATVLAAAVQPSPPARASATSVRHASGPPIVCGATLIVAGAAHTPAGHYGGAPDGLPTGYAVGAAIGHFPTRFKTRNALLPGTVGAFTVRADREWLGSPETAEPGRGAGPIQADCDPGEVQGPLVSLAPLRLYVTVSIAKSAPRGLRYLNAVVDLDADGRWNGAGGPREWVVRNCAIALPPGSIAVRVGCPWLQAARLTTTSSRATLAPSPHLYPMPAVWSRLLLARAPLPSNLYSQHGWDGAGPARGFPYGTVEDYLAGSSPIPVAAPRASAKPTFPILPTGTRLPATTAVIRATPTPSRTPGNSPSRTPTLSPTPLATATLTPQPLPTQTPAGPALSYISASYQYDPSSGQVQFRLKLAPLAPANQIYSLQWHGAPWSTAHTGLTPPHWTWLQSADGWDAATPDTPLFYGEILYFGLTVPLGTQIPDTISFVAADSAGHPIGRVESTNSQPAPATPTPAATVTTSPTASPTALPVSGIVSYYHFNPALGSLVLDLQVTSAQAAGQIFRVQLVGPPWTSAVVGSLSAGWSWQYLDGGKQAVTAANPLTPSAGLSMQLTLPPPRLPPSPLVVLAFDRFGRLLGQIVSQEQ